MEGKCKVCEKKMKVKRERIGRFGKRSGTAKDFYIPDEGVYFEGILFCNECWGEIRQKPSSKPSEAKVK